MSASVLDVIVPSTMIRGSWLRPVAFIDCGARRMMDGAEPGRPEADTIFAPGTLP